LTRTETSEAHSKAQIEGEFFRSVQADIGLFREAAIQTTTPGANEGLLAAVTLLAELEK
jgi:hypothetical protein